MKIALRLYYTGGSFQSEWARQELKRLRQQFSHVRFEIEEVDVVLSPAMAEEDDILATPTLIKFSPTPMTRIVSDLSQLEKDLDLNSFSHRR